MSRYANLVIHFAAPTVRICQQYYTLLFCFYRVELKDNPHKKCQSLHHLHNREISQFSVGCRVVEAVLTSEASIYRFFVNFAELAQFLLISLISQTGQCIY